MTANLHTFSMQNVQLYLLVVEVAEKLAKLWVIEAVVQDLPPGITGQLMDCRPPSLMGVCCLFCFLHRNLKSEYFSALISECCHDQTKLYRLEASEEKRTSASIII